MTETQSNMSSSLRDLDFNKAYGRAIESISKDMPFLQHGSGDVYPSEVLPATAQLLATLTVQYMTQLVDAALDAQSMQCDASQPQMLPPPKFPPRRVPPLPPPLAAATTTTTTTLTTSKKRRKRAGDEFWDEPVVPKIRPKNHSSNSNSNTLAAKRPTPIDEWVGVAGVDCLETSRARAAYVRGPHSLSTHCFLFPVCHDVYAYGRVLEVQAAKRSLEPLLLDPVVADMVRTEGRRTKKKQKSSRAATDDLEEEDDEEDNNEEANAKGGPMWPGLEYVLPVHRSNYGSEYAEGDED